MGLGIVPRASGTLERHASPTPRWLGLTAVTPSECVVAFGLEMCMETCAEPYRGNWSIAMSRKLGEHRSTLLLITYA